tara:strand:- start:7771 stop:8001 length:231 start_codon:yes stop_codon:yes gene_type:complete
MQRKVIKKSPGRPSNELAFKKMLKLLKAKKGITIPQLTERLELPKRTVYHYLKKAKEEGHRVVKLGSENSAPFCIL